MSTLAGNLFGLIIEIMFSLLYAKIVRILPRAQPFLDTIVGVTYDYLQRNGSSTSDIHEINQEIWVGNFTTPGAGIVWTQLKSDPKIALSLDELDLGGNGMHK